MPTPSTSAPVILADWLPTLSGGTAERVMSPFGVFCLLLLIIVAIGLAMASRKAEGSVFQKIGMVTTGLVGTAITLWAISMIFEAKAWYFRQIPPATTTP